MRVLGNPLGGDQRIISGESGAACLGLVAEVLQNKSMYEVRDQLGLDQRLKRYSASPPKATRTGKSYRKIVWDGLCPSF
jgi:diaminopropionate ammonia-lyase